VADLEVVGVAAFEFFGIPMGLTFMVHSCFLYFRQDLLDFLDLFWSLS
jgi:hypothetical protein